MKLIMKLKRYSPVVIKQPKIYLNDWSEVDERGERYENFVACHLKKAIDYWNCIKYNLKFPEPEKGIESIVSIPSMDECGVFCTTARPVVLTTNAKEYYGVSKIEDMVGKNVGVFRRVKDELGNYETPYVYYLQKGTIDKIECPWRFDMATVVVRTGEKLSEPIKIQRICIDW